MSLQNHEESEQPASPVEISLLMDDLADTYKQNVGACAIRMPDDFGKPADVILAGTIIEEDRQYEVVISQRASAEYLSLQPPRDDEVHYVIQLRRDEQEKYTCLVGDGRARHVWNGMPALSDWYVMFFRAVLNPQVVQWSAVAAEEEASIGDPYMWVRHFNKST